jgi:hypothetical protein
MPGGQSPGKLSRKNKQIERLRVSKKSGNDLEWITGYGYSSDECDRDGQIGAK